MKHVRAVRALHETVPRMAIFDWSFAVPQNICAKTGIFYLFFHHDLNLRIPPSTAQDNVQFVIVMSYMRLSICNNYSTL